MGFKRGIYFLTMPELQLTGEKDYDMGGGEKSFKNLNIERIVYFIMWAVIMTSYFFFGRINTFLVKVLLGTGSLFFIGLPLAEIAVTFLKTGKETEESKMTSERAVYFVAWTGLLFYHFYVEEAPGYALIIALLCAGFTYFIGIPIMHFIITLPKNLITAIYEMKKEDIMKLSFFYGIVVYVLPHLVFDKPKAYTVTVGLCIMGVIIFSVFFVVRLAVIQTLKFIKATVEVSRKAQNQFHGEELPVRPEEFSGEPRKMGYVQKVLGVLIVLTLFGVWVHYTDYNGFNYFSQYSSYIIAGGVGSIFLLWVITRRIREEKGDLIRGL